MCKLTNNSTRDCDLTHENLIPKTEVAKTTDINSNATSMPISVDMENGAELDSNVTDFECVSPISSNDSDMSNSDSKDTNDISPAKNEILNCLSPSSMRTDKKLIIEIGDFLDSFSISLGDSQIIQFAVKFAANYLSNPHKADLAQEIITEAENLHVQKNVTVTVIVTYRIPKNLKNKIKEIYPDSNFTLVTNCCLIALHHHLHASKSLSRIKNRMPLEEQVPLKPNEYLFSRFGRKKEELLDMIIRSIEEMRSNSKCTTYIEPFTGTANVLLHLKEFDHEEINDKEKALTNLLKVIKDDVEEFIATLLCCPVNEKVFEKLKNESTNLSNTPKNKSEKILNAVSFFYLTCLSLYGKRGSIRKDVNDETLLKKIIVIKKISKRLKNTKITNNDAFYFLKVVLKKGENELTKTIIYFDPPYIGTEWYYEVSEKEIKKRILKGAFHKRLRKIILYLKEKGANLAISYRATVTKNNKYGMTTEEVQKLLDDLYMNQDFFIQFQEVENEQIEILLTSEQVSGSVPYDCRIADLIKKYVRA